MLGENISTDGELSHHGVDQRLVTLVLWGVGELEIEWLQDMVKGTGSIANQAKQQMAIIMKFIMIIKFLSSLA